VRGGGGGEREKERESALSAVFVRSRGEEREGASTGDRRKGKNIVVDARR